MPAPAPEAAPEAAPEVAPEEASAERGAKASTADPAALFSGAVTAYKAGGVETARKEFLSIVEQGRLSAPLAHNLGNIEYRLGNSGQATLWYKRALAMDPFRPETLQNLRTVSKQTGFLTFDSLGVSLSHLKPRWFENAVILTGWTVGIAIVWLAWSPPRPGRRWPLVVLISVLSPVLIGSIAALVIVDRDPSPLAKRMVVSGEGTDAHAAPAEASSTIINLPPGSEIIPLETRGNWVYGMIPADKDAEPRRGWVRSVKLEPLWPYAAAL
ncbi:MAG: repeat-containing protein [Verrucomicrobiales bacterium]|nr:repeat-containing protein [Verrucomicrobiales bacterium]